MDDTDGMDLEALRESLRDVLAEQASHDRVAAFTDSEQVFDSNLWAQAAELGWPALSLPEKAGGLGLGPSELAVAFQELGRRTTPLPLLGTMAAGEAIKAGGTPEQQAAWLARLASGEIVAAVSTISPAGSPWAPRLEQDGEGFVLSGSVSDLLDGASAGLLVLSALEGESERWVIIDVAGDEVAVTRRATVDRTRHLGAVTFDRLRVSPDRVLADGAAAREAILRLAALALANDGIGGAEAVFEMTLDYLRTREQFGKPIGSFQALKHRCADHQVALVAAKALVAEAVRLAALDAPEAGRLLRQAKVAGCEVYVRIAMDAVQLHGGIGYTWEHPCHLYLKRAKLNAQLFGGAAAWQDAAVSLLLEAA